jgi:hypothetical protein
MQTKLEYHTLYFQENDVFICETSNTVNLFLTIGENFGLFGRVVITTNSNQPVMLEQSNNNIKTK